MQKNLRPKLTLRRLDKMENKALRRIDQLQRNLFDIRTLRARYVKEAVPSTENASKNTSK